MLSQSSVHEKFWSYAMLHACAVHNVMPSSKLPNEISPYEAVHSIKPDISKFRVWGCVSYYLVPDHENKILIDQCNKFYLQKYVDNISNGQSYNDNNNNYFVVLNFSIKIYKA